MNNNIQSISDSYKCSACGTCAAICPKKAISFKCSSMGRMYATVGEDCVACGKCIEVCPSIDSLNLNTTYKDPIVGTIQNVYVGKANNQDIFKQAQSGGMCTAMLCYLFDTGKIDAAVVTMMSPGNPPTVEAKIITQKEDLRSSQKSCYTPINLVSALSDAQNYKSIAVVGLPCHLQGVTGLMKTSKRFSNIKYKLGLICDRTLGATLQDTLMEYAGVRDQDVKIEWRKKDFSKNGVYYSYVQAPVVITSSSEQKIIPNEVRFALKDFFTLPACLVCKNKLNIHADIVFGDPWRMPDYDREHGASVVIVRTEIGKQLIEDCLCQDYCQLEERPVAQVLKGQFIEEKRKGNPQKDKMTMAFIKNEKLDKEAIIRKAIVKAKEQYTFKYKIKTTIISSAKKSVKKLLSILLK